MLKNNLLKIVLILYFQPSKNHYILQVYQKILLYVDQIQILFDHFALHKKIITNIHT